MPNLFVTTLKSDEYDRWNDFVDSSPQGSIFSKTWYLEGISKKFQIKIVKNIDDEIIAGMILCRHNRFKNIIFNGLYNGMLFKNMDSYKENKKNTLQIKLSNMLIESIPKFWFYYSSFHYEFKNWVSFLWNGFEQYTRYTYVIDNSVDINTVFDNFSNRMKNKIRKAEKNDSIQIIDESKTNDYLKEFYMLLEVTYKRQNKKVGISFDDFKRYDDMLKNNNSRKIFFVIYDGQIISGIYLLYDRKSTYLIMSGSLTEFRKYNPMALLIWNAIKYFNGIAIKWFDFEGSVMKNIELYSRQFGGVYKPYYVITKAENIFFDFLWYLKKKSRIKRLYANKKYD